MKKLLIIAVILFNVACSVENEEVVSEEATVADLVTSVDGCTVYDLSFDQDAKIEVRNFYDFIQVKVTKIGERDFNSLSIHFAKNENEFPRTGKGELNPSKFFYSGNVSKGTNEVVLNFTFDELGIQTGDNILITAIAEFGSKKNKEIILASDSVLTAENFYFQYNVEPFVNYAGTDQVKEITLSDAIALPSWDEVRKLYAGMLDSGVPKKAGTYNPSISDLIDDFNDPNRQSQLGDYTTTYTLGSGECSDSVELTMRVVPDPQ